MRVTVLAAFIGLLPAAVAGDGGLHVAFTSPDRSPGRARVVLASADGSAVVTLPSMAGDDFAPSWSPDGSRIAFVHREPRPHALEIYVANADGSGRQRLTFDSGGGRVSNVGPEWSPDGAWIAYRKGVSVASDELWLVRPDGSEQRRLTADGGGKTEPVWSPDSKRLAYVRSIARAEIYVVEVASGAAHTITPPLSWDTWPDWSPDGSRLAFSGDGYPTVARADGSGRARISRTRGDAPDWSPDGRLVAFAATRLFPELSNRFGPARRTDVFVVGADGSGERRLTGPLAEAFAVGLEGSAPTWWPDGSRLFFDSARPGDGGPTTYVMNADGSCEGRFAAVRVTEPAWPLGAAPSLPRRQCVELRVSVTAAPDALALRRPLAVTLRVENDGNQVASGLRLIAETTAPATVSGDSSCSRTRALVCALDPLLPGASQPVTLAISSAKPGFARLRVRVSADQAESDPSSNRVAVATQVLPCEVLGTERGDTLRGGRGRDRMCGRLGPDRIRGGAGDDYLDGGAGNDLVAGGGGSDTLLGRGERDVILARDGERDWIDCGRDRDTVVADRRDRILGGCERVLRR